jgi:hypothetical protein
LKWISKVFNTILAVGLILQTVLGVFLLKHTEGLPLGWMKPRLKGLLEYSDIYLTPKLELRLKNVELARPPWSLKAQTVTLNGSPWGLKKRPRNINGFLSGATLDYRQEPVLTALDSEFNYKGNTLSLTALARIKGHPLFLHLSPTPMENLHKMFRSLASSTSFPSVEETISPMSFTLRLEQNGQANGQFFSLTPFKFRSLTATSIWGNFSTQDFRTWEIWGESSGAQHPSVRCSKIHFNAQYRPSSFENLRLGGHWETDFLPAGTTPLFYVSIPHFSSTLPLLSLRGEGGLIDSPCGAVVRAENDPGKVPKIWGDYRLYPSFINLWLKDKGTEAIQFHRPTDGSFVSHRSEAKTVVRFFSGHIDHHGTKIKQLSGHLRCSKKRIKLQLDPLQTEDFSLGGRAYYEPSSGKGRVLMTGQLDPSCLNPYLAFLPDWWEPFWKAFDFQKNFPTGDIDVEFHPKDPHRFFFFGHVNAEAFRFNRDLFVRQLSLRFGGIPGYSTFFIPRFITHSGTTTAHVSWFYDPLSGDNKYWRTRGTSSFTLKDWSTLSAFFCPDLHPPGTFSVFTRLDDQPVVSFRGCLYEKYVPKTPVPLTIDARFPSASLMHLPCSHLWLSLEKWPHCLRGHHFRFHLDSGLCRGCFQTNSPNGISFHLEAEDLPSYPLLQHIPDVSSWFKDQAPAYDGFLKGKLTGSGQMGIASSFTMEGEASFRCPHLAQIHLLGPLSALLNKTPFSLSSVNFDEASGNFHLDNLCLKIPQMEMTGTTARASGEGELNLETAAIEARVRFHFFDHHRVKFPVIGYLLRLFQPFSNGFEAKLSGSFQSPKWWVGFNPLRFLTSGKENRPHR